MLLRNWSVEEGLTNGTRLRVTRLQRTQGNDSTSFAHMIECVVITRNGDDDRHVWIPRMKFVVDTETSGLDYAFGRVQFPITLAFAMTIHKSQGQTFDKVGIYLEHPVFAHGQLYVAMSRCRNADQLKVFKLCESDDQLLYKSTANIVWPEVLFDPPGEPDYAHLLEEDNEALEGFFDDVVGGGDPVP